MKVNNNIDVTVLKGELFINLKKHKPIIINAEDKYRKGVEIDICSKCKCLSVISGYYRKNKYCIDCSNTEMFK